MPKKQETVRVEIVLLADVHAEMKALAKDQQESVATFLRAAIRHEIERRVAAAK